MKKHLAPAAFAASAALLAGIGAASAAPIAASGYSVGTFAVGPAGTSGADSIQIVGNNVYVGYSNGTPPDGSSGSSTIAEFSRTGVLLNSTSVAGHNDGLRYDAALGKLWSMQNEDGHSTMVLMTPGSLAQSAPYTYSAFSHGGGYDDAVFLGGKTFLSASNPSANPNTAPALVSATLGAGVVNVTGVLNGTASATPLTPGSPASLNLQDPDSLSKTQDGKLVLDSQGDGVLVFVSNPGTSGQTASSMLLANGVTVDDTVFAGVTDRTLLVVDKKADTVYAITGAFGFNTGYSAAQDANGAGFVGALNQTNGSYAPIVTGFGNPGGEAFLPVPEPATVTMLGLGVLGLAMLRRRA